VLKLGLIAVIIGLLFYTHVTAIGYGKRIQAGIEAQARQNLIKTQKERVKIVYKEKVKIEYKYRDKVKTIYQAIDPTGCLDKSLADIGLLPASTTD